MANPTFDVSLTPVYAATPLPPGWTEHRAPTGQFYYYHAATQESTYVRPSIAEMPSSASVVEKKAGKKEKKKEKPKTKKPIPGTSWLKVTTNEDNVFYTNTETKLSVWTVPDEIKDAVKRLQEQEILAIEEVARQAEQEKLAKAEETRRAHEAEQKRIIELEVQKVRAEVEAEAALRGLKRKPEGHSSALDTQSSLPSKMALLDPASQAFVNALDSSVGGPRKLQKIGEDLDQDEEWQRQIAEEMALEAEKEVDPVVPQSVQAIHPAALPTPLNTVLAGFTSDELKATFKAMLSEKSIDPMAPWDNELPKFVTDPRYLALSSIKERRDLFDEFCKGVIRQRRAEKQATAKLDPAQAYRTLLIETVTSTRTHWEEFRTKHKKDTRFRNFGRDDREREKTFKSWLKELGEHKRVEAIKAEEDFTRFLDEKREELEKSHAKLVDAEWKEVRDYLKKDKRFDIITSNTVKEGVWKKWVKHLNEQIDRKPEGYAQEAKQEKQEASLKARAEDVRQQRARLEKQTDKTRNELARDEAERAFSSLLVDAVRDHDETWEDVYPSLEKDSRFQQSKMLSLQNLKRLFTDHTSSIYAKRLSALESFFEEHASSLAASFAGIEKKLLGLIDEMSDEPSQSSMSPERVSMITTVNRLINNRSRNEGFKTIEFFFDNWKRKKEARAREEFEEMCGESSFIDFWCRLKNAAKENEVGGKTVGEDGKDEDDDEVVDLRDMAKSIDLSEIEAVLKKDKRWVAWDHLPDKRESWIRAYLDNLTAPKLTVYQKS